MKFIRIAFLSILFTFSVLFLSACAAPTSRTLENQERDDVLVYSEAKTDRLLAALTSGDYKEFTADMDPIMVKGMPEENFNKLRDSLFGKLGQYISREVEAVSAVSQSGDFFVVEYLARYDLDEKVTIRVVFTADETHKVTGLWFNSPTLNETKE